MCRRELLEGDLGMVYGSYETCPAFQGKLMKRRDVARERNEGLG